jgi:hypothetical protein
MNTTPELRRSVYALMIVVTAATAAGRVCSAQRLYEPRFARSDATKDDPLRGIWPATRPNPSPTFGDNDRSRWVTVRALVDEGTYVIAHRYPDLKGADGLDDRNLAIVTGLSAFGEPNALQAAASAMAGREARGPNDAGDEREDGWKTIDKVMNPETHDFYSSKPPLLPTMAAGEYWLLKQLFGWTITDNSWEVVITTLLTFNVLPLVLYLVLLASLVERYGTSDWGRLFVMTAGCFGTLLTPFVVTFNNHSIGTYAAMLTLWGAAHVLDSDPDKPGWRVDGLFLLTGFAAGFTAVNELPAAAFAAAIFLLIVLRSPVRGGLLFVAGAAVPVAAWFVTNYLAVGRFAPVYSEFGGRWYEFEGAYWRFTPGKRGIDWAGRNGETKPEYAFHVLLGHHGAFSLTPVYLLALAGMMLAVWRAMRWGVKTLTPTSWNRLVALSSAVVVVVIGYYIYKTDNYGGWTNGPRWLIWLAPLWLLALLPVADYLGRSRAGRAVALVLLAFSVFSASYSLWNPWRHPWIYDLMNARGLIPY